MAEFRSTLDFYFNNPVQPEAERVSGTENRILDSIQENAEDGGYIGGAYDRNFVDARVDATREGAGLFNEVEVYSRDGTLSEGTHTFGDFQLHESLSFADTIKLKDKEGNERTLRRDELLDTQKTAGTFIEDLKVENYQVDKGIYNLSDGSKIQIGQVDTVLGSASSQQQYLSNRIDQAAGGKLPKEFLDGYKVGVDLPDSDQEGYGFKKVPYKLIDTETNGFVTPFSLADRGKWESYYSAQDRLLSASEKEKEKVASPSSAPAPSPNASPGVVASDDTSTPVLDPGSSPSTVTGQLQAEIAQQIQQPQQQSVSDVEVVSDNGDVVIQEPEQKGWWGKTLRGVGNYTPQGQTLTIGTPVVNAAVKTIEDVVTGETTQDIKDNGIDGVKNIGKDFSQNWQQEHIKAEASGRTGIEKVGHNLFNAIGNFDYLLQLGVNGVAQTGARLDARTDFAPTSTGKKNDDIGMDLFQSIKDIENKYDIDLRFDRELPQEHRDIVEKELDGALLDEINRKTQNINNVQELVDAEKQVDENGVTAGFFTKKRGDENWQEEGATILTQLIAPGKVAKGTKAVLFAAKNPLKAARNVKSFFSGGDDVVKNVTKTAAQTEDVVKVVEKIGPVETVKQSLRGAADKAAEIVDNTKQGIKQVTTKIDDIGKSTNKVKAATEAAKQTGGVIKEKAGDAAKIVKKAATNSGNALEAIINSADTIGLGGLKTTARLAAAPYYVAKGISEFGVSGIRNASNALPTIRRIAQDPDSILTSAAKAKTLAKDAITAASFSNIIKGAGNSAVDLARFLPKAGLVTYQSNKSIDLFQIPFDGAVAELEKLDQKENLSPEDKLKKIALTTANFINPNNVRVESAKLVGTVLRATLGQYANSDIAWVRQAGYVFNPQAYERDALEYENLVTTAQDLQARAEEAANPASKAELQAQLETTLTDLEDLESKMTTGNPWVDMLIQTAAPMILSYGLVKGAKNGLDPLAKGNPGALSAKNNLEAKLQGGVIYSGIAYNQIADSDLTPSQQAQYLYNYEMFERLGKDAMDVVFRRANDVNLRRISKDVDLKNIKTESISEWAKRIEKVGITDVAASNTLIETIYKQIFAQKDKGFFKKIREGFETLGPQHFATKIGHNFFSEGVSEAGQTILEEDLNGASFSEAMSKAGQAFIIGGAMGAMMGDAVTGSVDFASNTISDTVTTVKSGNISIKGFNEAKSRNNINRLNSFLDSNINVVLPQGQKVRAVWANDIAKEIDDGIKIMRGVSYEKLQDEKGLGDLEYEKSRKDKHNKSVGEIYVQNPKNKNVMYMAFMGEGNVNFQAVDHNGVEKYGIRTDDAFIVMAENPSIDATQELIRGDGILTLQELYAVETIPIEQIKDIDKAAQFTKEGVKVVDNPFITPEEEIIRYVKDENQLSLPLKDLFANADVTPVSKEKKAKLDALAEKLNTEIDADERIKIIEEVEAISRGEDIQSEEGDESVESLDADIELFNSAPQRITDGEITTEQANEEFQQLLTKAQDEGKLQEVLAQTQEAAQSLVQDDTDQEVSEEVNQENDIEQEATDQETPEQETEISQEEEVPVVQEETQEETEVTEEASVAVSEEPDVVEEQEITEIELKKLRSLIKIVNKNMGLLEDAGFSEVILQDPSLSDGARETLENILRVQTQPLDSQELIIKVANANRDSSGDNRVETLGRASNGKFIYTNDPDKQLSEDYFQEDVISNEDLAAIGLDPDDRNTETVAAAMQDYYQENETALDTESRLNFLFDLLYNYATEETQNRTDQAIRAVSSDKNIAKFTPGSSGIVILDGQGSEIANQQIEEIIFERPQEEPLNIQGLNSQVEEGTITSLDDYINTIADAFDGKSFKSKRDLQEALERFAVRGVKRDGSRGNNRVLPLINGSINKYKNDPELLKDATPIANDFRNVLDGVRGLANEGFSRVLIYPEGKRNVKISNYLADLQSSFNLHAPYLAANLAAISNSVLASNNREGRTGRIDKNLISDKFQAQAIIDQVLEFPVQEELGNLRAPLGTEQLTKEQKDQVKKVFSISLNEESLNFNEDKLTQVLYNYTNVVLDKETRQKFISVIENNPVQDFRPRMVQDVISRLRGQRPGTATSLPANRIIRVNKTDDRGDQLVVPPEAESDIREVSEFINAPSRYVLFDRIVNSAIKDANSFVEAVQGQNEVVSQLAIENDLTHEQRDKLQEVLEQFSGNKDYIRKTEVSVDFNTDGERDPNEVLASNQIQAIQSENSSISEEEFAEISFREKELLEETREISEQKAIISNILDEDISNIDKNSQAWENVQNIIEKSSPNVARQLKIYADNYSPVIPSRSDKEFQLSIDKRDKKRKQEDEKNRASVGYFFDSLGDVNLEDIVDRTAKIKCPED